MFNEFIESYKKMFTNYTTFTGRTHRKDYWGAVLINFIIGVVLGILAEILSIFGILSCLYSLAVLVPGIAMSIRRMHDIGKSGWFVLLGLIPFVGWIIVLVLACIDSDPEENIYGPNPKEVE